MSDVDRQDMNPEGGLAAALMDVVGERHVITDPDLLASYESDITGRYSGMARLVVLPKDTDECSRVLSVCADARVPVVPQGGNTGLVGGAVPHGEIILGTRRMSIIEALDEAAMQMTVGAGVTLADAQDAAKRAGYELTIDHSARSAATIGGMAATDAGGSMALKYGTMRSHIVGMEAVLADGSVISRLSGLIKDNAGYRWPDVLVGSEGTLAVLTRIRLGLVRHQPQRVSALFGVDSFPEALELLRSLREHTPSLRAADFFTAAGLELVCRHRKLPQPLRHGHPLYVIVECAGPGDLMGDLALAADGAGENVVADDSMGQERLWLYRDGQNEAVRAEGVPHKLDVSVPLTRISTFVDTLNTLLARERFEAHLVLWGHLGDGNLHVNILGLDDDDYAIDEAVLRLVAKCGGSISAEHGIGVAKTAWLDLVRSPEEIALMRSIKSAFDPRGLLSPGRVLPELA